MSGTIDVRLRMAVSDTIGDGLRNSLVLGTIYSSGTWLDPSFYHHSWSQISGTFSPSSNILGNLVNLNSNGSFQFLTTPSDVPELSPNGADFTIVSIFNLRTLPSVSCLPWFLAIKDNFNGDDEYSVVAYPTGCVFVFDFLINDNNTFPDVSDNSVPLVTGTNYVVIAYYKQASQSIHLKINDHPEQVTFCNFPMSVISAPTTLDIGVDSADNQSPSSNPLQYLDGNIRVYIFNRLLTELEKNYLRGTSLYP